MNDIVQADAVESGVAGFVRSYGKYLPEENITLNAICPNVVRTHISTDTFYDSVEAEGVLTPMKGVVDAFASCLDDGISGELLEVGPNGGFSAKPPAPHLDKETTRILDMIYHRVSKRECATSQSVHSQPARRMLITGSQAHPLHEPEH